MNLPQNRLFYLICAIVIILIAEKITGCNAPETRQAGDYNDSTTKVHQQESERFSDSIDSTIAIQMKMSKDFDSIMLSRKK